MVGGGKCVISDLRAFEMPNRKDMDALLLPAMNGKNGKTMVRMVRMVMVS